MDRLSAVDQNYNATYLFDESSITTSDLQNSAALIRIEGIPRDVQHPRMRFGDFDVTDSKGKLFETNMTCAVANDFSTDHGDAPSDNESYVDELLEVENVMIKGNNVSQYHY